jgi:hypothetical protein
MKKHFLFLIMVVLFTVTCSKEQPLAPNKQTYIIAGMVTDNGRALPGVVVSAGTYSAVTDTSGRYEIQNVPNGMYTVRPAKGGCAFSPDTISVIVADANLADNNFSTRIFTAADIKSCLFEVHGIVLEQHDEGTSGAVSYDTLDISVTMPRTSTFKYILYFDIIRPSPGSGFSAYQNFEWLAVCLFSSMYITDVEYASVYNVHNEVGFGYVTYDSLGMQIWTRSPSPFEYRIIGETLLKQWINDIAHTVFHLDFPPEINPRINKRTTRYLFLPDAEIHVQLQ